LIREKVGDLFLKKRMIIGIVVAAAAMLLAVGGMIAQSAAEQSRPVTPTTGLNYGTLTRSVSASGTVESVHTYNVYSALALMVESVSVKEGQYVEKGAVLAQLDVESLELDIRQQRASLTSTETNTDLDIEGKRQAYQNARERSALSLENALRSYELLAAQAESGAYPELVSAQTSVDNAKMTLDNAKADLDSRQKAYDDNLFLFELGEVSRQALDASGTALEASLRAYDGARRTYDTAVTNQGNTAKRVGDDVETARKRYESDRLTAEQEVGNAKRVYESALAASSMEAAWINLEKLEKQLRDATVTAPISGTVTKVYAREGNPGNGLLFIIEDLRSLEIVTRVKEYDAAGVQPGMSVIIKSDATGEREISGAVKSVAPTSEKNSAGMTLPGNVVEYVTVVTVNEPDSGLKIGMNTRLNIVLETKEDVLLAPYDAVIEEAGGEFKLYVVDAVTAGDRPRHVARSVPVSLGMETDFAVEVSGADLTEGMIIVSDPSSVTEGEEVKLQ